MRAQDAQNEKGRSCRHLRGVARAAHLSLAANRSAEQYCRLPSQARTTELVLNYGDCHASDEAVGSQLDVALMIGRRQQP